MISVPDELPELSVGDPEAKRLIQCRMIISNNYLIRLQENTVIQISALAIMIVQLMKSKYSSTALRNNNGRVDDVERCGEFG